MAGALALLVANERTPAQLEAEFAPFFAEHAVLRLDPKARSPVNTRVVARQPTAWTIEQVLLDPEEDNDWVLVFQIDLLASRAEARPVMTLLRVEGPSAGERATN
jgi:hypothetical protein